MNKLRIALAQINPTVGDLRGNVKKIVSRSKKARAMKADIIAFPELAVTGYPPEDLLLKPQFVEDNIAALDNIIAASKGIITVTGFVDKKNKDTHGICNAAAVISDCKLIDVYHKKHLPNYGVFDEYRYFQPGSRYPVYEVCGVHIGINICEDIWHEEGPVRIQALSGADVIININASPYHMDKASFREQMISKRATDNNVLIIYVNMVGGQDELVFDGGSFVADRTGSVVVRARQFKEDLIFFDVNIKKLKAARKPGIKKIKLPHGEGIVRKKIDFLISGKKPLINLRKSFRASLIEEVYNALLLGTRDYVEKNGFKGVIIGLSGGVDSSLVAAIAVDAIGSANVHGLFMPSPYTSKESREDAYKLAKNLGIKIMDIPVNSIFKSYLKALLKGFKGMKADITEENIQARIRGNILMAFSNKFGWLVLTTGNKSEMSVGYATLYGDMAGGFAVIKDVPKTMVYDICEWKNEKEGSDVIPKRVLWKEPTAELRPNQRDTDTLPPYPVLDPVLKAYVEEDKTFGEIINMGCDIECAKKIIGMVDHSEYKRRQAPPGIKITPRAFGKDRRFPITNKYRSY
ncbi:MAG: NAD+ synthase [Nitrospirae bacterium]|nr:NAD+ synthase [Nitrospirota bacterium]